MSFNSAQYLLSCSFEIGKRYLELNSIKSLTVCKHHLGDKTFQLWEMNSEKTGFYTEYKLKRDAIADARKIAERFNLPLEVE